jgi:CheY-like chemotaxis protein
LLCQQRAFVAITLDMLLPDMGGMQLLHEVRATPLNADTPVVALTVSAERELSSGFRLHDYLTKPVREDALLATLRRAQVLPASTRPILVVDDDPGALRLADATLRAAGYQCVCYSSGQDALLASQAEPPAAVILDLLMPGMDGFEFIDRFKRTPQGRGAPIIIWTVKDLTADDRDRLRVSAHSVVSKSLGGSAGLVDELRALWPDRAPAER